MPGPSGKGCIMLILFSVTALLTFYLVLRLSAPAGSSAAAPGSAADEPVSAIRAKEVASHGKGLADRGKSLQDAVSGGKKCPHCGKPI